MLWHTGLRIGAAVGLDIDDYNADEQYLALVHRPDEETSLKLDRLNRMQRISVEHGRTAIDQLQPTII